LESATARFPAGYRSLAISPPPAAMPTISKKQRGNIKVRAEKGVMKKFSSLSKIFSLINFYQMVKLNLPDYDNKGDDL